MAFVNLLPWRQVARREKQKEYLSILAVTGLLSFLAVFGVNLMYAQMLTDQMQRNDLLTTEIAILDSRIAEIKTLNDTKVGLQQRMALIEQLQSSRNLGTRVFTEVAKVVPSGIYFSKLEKQGDELLVLGKTESNNRLSQMLRQVEDSKLLTFVNLRSIVATNDRARFLSDFSLQLRVDRTVAFEEGIQ